jgi:hypothetical protein
LALRASLPHLRAISAPLRAKIKQLRANLKIFTKNSKKVSSPLLTLYWYLFFDEIDLHSYKKEDEIHQ